jgi:hypothetical protein
MVPGDVMALVNCRVLLVVDPSRVYVASVEVFQ